MPLVRSSTASTGFVARLTVALAFAVLTIAPVTHQFQLGVFDRIGIHPFDQAFLESSPQLAEHPLMLLEILGVVLRFFDIALTKCCQKASLSLRMLVKPAILHTSASVLVIVAAGFFVPELQLVLPDLASASAVPVVIVGRYFRIAD